MSIKSRRTFLRMLSLAPLAASALLGCNAMPITSAHPPELAANSAPGALQQNPVSPASAQQPIAPAAMNQPVASGASRVPNSSPSVVPPGKGNGHVHGPGCGPDCTHEVTPVNPGIPNQAVVVIRKGDDQSDRMVFNLDQETHIQDLMARSGASRRYSRIDLQLIRTSPDGQKHRMGVEFDRTTRKVKPESDYYIRPGDVLVVSQDTTTFIDDLVGRKGKPKKGSSGGLGAMLGGL